MLVFVMIGLILSICIITVIVILIKKINYFPQKEIDIDITGKSNMDNNDLIDFYIFNFGTQIFEEHIYYINEWKKSKLNKFKLNNKKIEKFNNKCEKNCYKAFKIVAYRNRTRYKQINYERYKVNVQIICNNFLISDIDIKNRIAFLKQHNYNVSYNNYNKEDQRKALTKALKEKIKIRDNYTCQICGKYMPDEVGLHIDHIIPINKGGKSIPDNLRVLCSKCNGRKGDKKDDTLITQPFKMNFDIERPIKTIENNLVKRNKSTCDNLIAEYDQAFFELDTNLMCVISSKLLVLKPTTDENRVSLHFALMHCSDINYSMSHKDERLKQLSIDMCIKDIAMYNHLSNILGSVRIGTLSRLAIIYEKEGRLQDAINLCDLGIKYKFVDSNGKNFIFRKERLEKKIK